MKEILIILAALLVTFAAHNHANATDLKGKWIQTEEDADGYRNVYLFRDSGHFEAYYCQIIESYYKVENNLLVVTSLTPKVDPPVHKYVYNVEDNRLIIQKILSENPLQLSQRWVAMRLPGRKKDKNNPLVGQWQYDLSDFPAAIHEYTDNGWQLFITKEISYVRGVYAIVDNKLSLWPMIAKVPTEYEFSYDDENLILYKEGSEKKVYRRIY